jgi:alpha-mannosidase
MHHQARFTARKIALRLQLIEPLVHRQRLPIPPFRYQPLPSPLELPPVAPELDDSAWPTIPENSAWGAWQTDFALRATFQAPPEWAIELDRGFQKPVALYLPLGEAGDFSHPEALVYIDGAPYAACDRHHQEILLPAGMLDGQTHALALHGWTGLGGDVVTPRQGRLHMRPCFVVQIDQLLREFITTARVALGVAEALEQNHPAKDALLNALENAFKDLDTREPFGEAFYQSVLWAKMTLQEGIRQAGAPMPVDLVASGHAHLDVAWLWTLGQTRRKAGRTFYNVLRLMERYPFFHFTQSQPQLYDFVRQDYPDLFNAIQERVFDGQWEPIGGMWVEADCNLSGSESLARQFLYGRSFFRQFFGPEAESPVLWLPDVFGYAWNLPQLIRQAGLKYFFTIKIGWSQYNRLPYDTFWWQGLDGTRVLTHFSTSPDPGSYASTYNAMATPAEVIGTWENFQQKELPQPLLMAFGFGDGGGGPTAEMIDNLSEMGEFPGAPRVRQGKVGDFFSKVEDQVGEQLPVWNGELYLELHRGTYTTQSRNKMANRRSEFLLHDAEFLATYASLLDPAYHYPAEDLRQAWQLVCLNQFHDIIPGSSIGAVYIESQAQYADIRRIAESVTNKALSAIAGLLGVDGLAVNPTSFARNDLAEAGVKVGRFEGWKVQETDEGVLLDVGELPPFSVVPLALLQASPGGSGSTHAADPARVFDRRTATGEGDLILENSCLRAEFSSIGDLTRLYDKIAQREVLPAGVSANIFQAFEDRPNAWDAWDIDIHFEDRLWLAEPADSIRVVEDGPLRACLEIRRLILNSLITQRISLMQDNPRLDFATTIDWHEKHILLKVAFPVNVLSPTATYEIQWGNVERPTHRNTSWDWARFETAAQKWVDLSEGNYGVSLLNDGKYGHDIHDHTIRLSLLRSPTNPDPTADQGEHHFTYSLLPHHGAWDERTIAQAYALNDPLIVWHARQPAASAPRPSHAASLISVSAPNLVIETIKRAEDGLGVIVRLYESQRQRGLATLRFLHPLQAAWRANLLEENQEELPVDGGQATFTYRPYEIITLRLVA